MKQITFALACLAGLVLLTLTSQAQSFNIDWFTIAGGGGTSTGGVYSVSGTIGQPDAGAMSGGNYSLTGGYWALLVAVQTPGAPTLTITLLNSTQAMISWPSPSAGFTLQTNGNLANPAGWSDYVGAIGDNGTIKSVTNSPPTGKLFFRLKHL